jgi:hypothetical protein
MHLIVFGALTSAGAELLSSERPRLGQKILAVPYEWLASYRWRPPAVEAEQRPRTRSEGREG